MQISIQGGKTQTPHAKMQKPASGCAVPDFSLILNKTPRLKETYIFNYMPYTRFIKDITERVKHYKI